MDDKEVWALAPLTAVNWFGECYCEADEGRAALPEARAPVLADSFGCDSSSCLSSARSLSTSARAVFLAAADFNSARSRASMRAAANWEPTRELKILERVMPTDMISAPTRACRVGPPK